MGLINDWTLMEKLLEYNFEDVLRQNSEDQSIVLVQNPNSILQKDPEKLANLLFETFSVNKVCVINSSVLSLIKKTGSITGMVVDSGDSLSQVIPIEDGYLINFCLKHTPIAGRAITSYLYRLSNEAGYSFEKSSDFHKVMQIKEKLAFITNNYDKSKEEEFQTKRLKVPSKFNKAFLKSDGNELI